MKSILPLSRQLQQQISGNGYSFGHGFTLADRLYKGTDSREFWQRAEDRNRDTAELYNRLGLDE